MIDEFSIEDKVCFDMNHWRLIEQIRGLCLRLDSQERRIDVLEKHSITTDNQIEQFRRVWRWAAGVLAGVVIGVIVGAIAFAFGWP